MDGIRRYAGIDWASERHAMCVIDERGQVVSRFEVEHTAAGLRELVRRLRGVEGVAVERPDGPVINALLEAGIAVFVIASRRQGASASWRGPGSATWVAHGPRVASEASSPLDQRRPAVPSCRGG